MSTASGRRLGRRVAEDAPIDGERPLSRAYRPEEDPGMRRAVEDILHAKGSALRPAYAALCIVRWLQDARDRTAVCAADVRALYPRRPGVVAAPMRDPASHLRRAAEDGLLTAFGSGWYAITPLGRAVVEALPDGALVGVILGRRSASCTPRLDRDWRRE